MQQLTDVLFGLLKNKSVLCCSVAYHSVFSCVDDLDESRSLQLKSLLSEYFDKRRDGDHALESLDLEELDKYKVFKTPENFSGVVGEVKFVNVLDHFCVFVAVGLGGSNQSRYQKFSRQPK